MADLKKLGWEEAEDRVLGGRIQKAREARGVSLQTLADFMDVSKATAGHWETGARSIKHHDFARLCAALNVSADQLLFGRSVWPFSGVDADKVQQLDAQDLAKLEGGLLLTAAQIGLDIAREGANSRPNIAATVALGHPMSLPFEHDSTAKGPQELGVSTGASWDETTNTKRGSFKPMTGGSSSTTTKGQQPKSSSKRRAR